MIDKCQHMIDLNRYIKRNILTFEDDSIIFLVKDSTIMDGESPDCAEDWERESQTPHVVSGTDQSWLSQGWSRQERELAVTSLVISHRRPAGCHHHQY